MKVWHPAAVQGDLAGLAATWQQETGQDGPWIKWHSAAGQGILAGLAASWQQETGQSGPGNCLIWKAKLAG